MELPDLPEGWVLLGLTNIAPRNAPDDWSVRVRCENGDFTHGRGSTPRYAFLNAIDKIAREEVYSPCEDPFNPSPIDLVKELGIPAPKKVERIDRR